MGMRFARVALSGAALWAMAAASAGAQTAGPTSPVASPANGELEQVVVTARRRAENIQTVPVSVNAFSAADIQKRSVESAVDVARFTPGFAYESLGGQGNPVIRGMNQKFTNVFQNVATFYNGLYLQKGFQVDSVSLLDMDRIEVVKGPQSAVYGRNAFAGALNFVSKVPTDRFEVNAASTIGNYGRLDYGGSVNLPMVPGRLEAMVTAIHSEYGGSWANVHPLANQGSKNGTKGNLGGYGTNAYSVSVRARPIDPLTIDVNYTYNHGHKEESPGYNVGTTSATNLINSLNCSPLPDVGSTSAATVQNRLFCGKLPIQPPAQAGRPAGLLRDPREYSYSGSNKYFTAKAEYRFNDRLTATYLFGLSDSVVSAIQASSANDLVPLSPIYAAVYGAPGQTVFATQETPNGSYKSYQNEGRLQWRPWDRLTLMVGADYSESDDYTFFDLGTGQIGNLVPVHTGGLVLQKFNQHVNSAGAFFSAELAVTDRLKVTAEGRYTHDKLIYDNFASAAANFNISNAFRRTLIQKYFTPRFTADYTLAQDHLIYASVAKGVEDGGYNNGPLFFYSQCPLATQTLAACPAGSRNTAQESFNAQSNWTYELGSKNEFFDRRLRLNFDVFYVDWSNLQVSGGQNDTNPLLPIVALTANRGGVTVKGAELEGQFAPMRHVLLNFGASYTDAKYNSGDIDQAIRVFQGCDGVVCPVATSTSGGNIGGHQLERAPKWQLVGGAEYSSSFSNGLQWFVRADATWQSKEYVEDQNLAYVPSRTLVNMRAGISGDRWSLEAWSKNLTNEAYATQSFYISQANRSVGYGVFLGEKRTFGATLRLKYN